MNTTFSFTITSLIFQEGYLQGPVEQIGFASVYAELLGISRPLNRLCRVEFLGSPKNIVPEGGEPLTETLVFGSWWEAENKLLYLCAKGGKSYVHIASAFYNTPKIGISDEYQDVNLKEKLTYPEINKIFQTIWQHPMLILPPGTSLPIE